MNKLRTETIAVKVTPRAKKALEYRAFQERTSVSSLIWKYLQQLPLEEWAVDADSFFIENQTTDNHDS
jgi:hypothetical protein